MKVRDYEWQLVLVLVLVLSEAVLVIEMPGEYRVNSFDYEHRRERCWFSMFPPELL